MAQRFITQKQEGGALIIDTATDKTVESVAEMIDILNSFDKFIKKMKKDFAETEKDLKAGLREYRKQIRAKDSQIKALNKIIAKLMRE